MKKKFIYRGLVALSMAVAMLSACHDIDPDPEPEPDPIYRFEPSTDSVAVVHEFRAAWLSTVYSLDWPTSKDVAGQKASLRNYIQQIKECNCNAVIFQVVAMSDAMFPSKLLPWSKELTGTQGTDPGYDPLAYAVECCRELGLEIHAWINPLRVTKTESDYNAMCSSNRYFSHMSEAKQVGTAIYWDPSYESVQDYLAELVGELLTNYDLDGIHMDDYFYPSGIKGSFDKWNDRDNYELYGNGKTIDQWRFDNIDRLVKRLWETTHQTRPEAVFGVSPQGQLANTQALYADPTHWTEGQYIDYLAPQIYWQIGHSTADFSRLAAFWPTVANGIPVTPGIAVYRLGESGFPTTQEFVNEIALCRSIKGISGHIWFRTTHLIANNFKPDLQKQIYRYPSLLPKFGKFEGKVPETPVIRLAGDQISWSGDENADGYAVYKLTHVNKGLWRSDIVQMGDKCSFKGEANGNYAVIAYNREEKSEMSNVVFIEE